MTFLKLLGNGFGAVRRHPRLVLAAYLVPLLPALAVAAMARANLAPTLDYSLFSQRVLGGRAFDVWRDFAASPQSDLGVLLGAGVFIAVLAAALAQIPVAAGTVEVLLARDGVEHPFFTGIARHSGRFLRALLWYLPALALAAGAAGGAAAALFKAAEKRSNAALDLVGMGAAAAVALLLLAIFDPAYDLARIAAARHDDRRTLRGFLRAIWLVLHRPAIFLPLYVSIALLIVALHLGYTAARSPFTPATAAAIAAVLVAQQLVMAARAAIQVTAWGAVVGAYRELGEPRLCEKRARRKALLVVDEPPATPLPEPAGAPAEAEPAADVATAPAAPPEAAALSAAAQPASDDVFTTEKSS
jgi:hypothetical protein